MKNPLRHWIGDDWGPMLGLLAMLAAIPAIAVANGAYELGAILSLIFVGPFVAWVIVRHYRDTPTGKAFIDTLRDLGLGLWALTKVVAAVGSVMGGLWLAYVYWYPHKAATLVYTNGNWMQGEKRNCVLVISMKPYQLDCTVKVKTEEPHQFDVTYTGADPADQDKDKPQAWTCTRETSSISCNTSK